MKEHPLNDMLRNSLNNMNGLIDSSKVIGNPILLSENQIAVPINKVVCGFGVGGSEFVSKNQKESKKYKEEFSNELFPFGGGSGGAMSIQPTALLLLSEGKAKIIKIDKENSLLEMAGDAIKSMLKKE